MSQTPPLLPAEILRRVLRLSRCEGALVLAVAGSLAVASAALGDYLGAVIGVIIAGAGVFELHGASLLRAGKARGVNWLVGSQLYLLFSVVGYCALRITHAHVPAIPEELAPAIEMNAEQFGMTSQAYLLMAYRFAFQLVALLTLFYQGGMALYYHRRRRAVAAALAEQGFRE
jgi:hypothetical protein